MIEQRDVQRCNKGCCLFVNARKVSKEEYAEAIKGISGATRGAAIPCLKEETNKAIADETGFYVGGPVTNSEKSSIDSFAYDTKTHAYLRIATNKDYILLKAARRKVDGVKQAQRE
jgi:hypothetical protein